MELRKYRAMTAKARRTGISMGYRLSGWGEFSSRGDCKWCGGGGGDGVWPAHQETKRGALEAHSAASGDGVFCQFMDELFLLYAKR